MGRWSRRLRRREATLRGVLLGALLGLCFGAWGDPGGAATIGQLALLGMLAGGTLGAASESFWSGWTVRRPGAFPGFVLRAGLVAAAAGAGALLIGLSERRVADALVVGAIVAPLATIAGALVVLFVVRAVRSPFRVRPASLLAELDALATWRRFGAAWVLATWPGLTAWPAARVAGALAPYPLVASLAIGLAVVGGTSVALVARRRRVLARIAPLLDDEVALVPAPRARRGLVLDLGVGHDRWATDDHEGGSYRDRAPEPLVVRGDREAFLGAVRAFVRQDAFAAVAVATTLASHVAWATPHAAFAFEDYRCARERWASCAEAADRLEALGSHDRRGIVRRHREACDKGGIAASCARVGELRGAFVAGSDAVRGYEAACAAGDAPACRALGVFLGQEAREDDRRRGAELLQKACDLGDAVGCDRLARAR